MVLALINTVFAQDSAEAASAQWRTVADQLRGKFPKLAAMMDEAEPDVLAFKSFPRRIGLKSPRRTRWNDSMPTSSAGLTS
jgi:transposase-like protein